MRWITPDQRAPMSAEDLLCALCSGYRYAHDLTPLWITRMAYLADWRHVLTCGMTLTRARWFAGPHGPHSPQVSRALAGGGRLVVVDGVSALGAPRRLVALAQESPGPRMPAEARASIEHVLACIERVGWRGLCDIVAGTHPMRTGAPGCELDLVALAGEYHSGCASSTGAR